MHELSCLLGNSSFLLITPLDTFGVQSMVEKTGICLAVTVKTLMDQNSTISLEVIKPDPRLAKYIMSLWIFRNDMICGASASRIIVPTGCAKIVFPLKNDLFVNGKRLKRGKIHFVGISDEPVVVTSNEGQVGNVIIKVKWTPHGASHFVPLAMNRAANTIFSFDEVFGHSGGVLQESIADVADVYKKIDFMQEFLLNRLSALDHRRQVVDFAAESIIQTKGIINIKNLERKTGYSERYLRMLFDYYIGLSPKTLASIVRFQQVYKLCASNPCPDFYKSELYKYYHDQSHFIKEFKRFTGYTPNKYAGTDNESGRILCRQ